MRKTCTQWFAMKTITVQARYNLRTDHMLNIIFESSVYSNDKSKFIINNFNQDMEDLNDDANDIPNQFAENILRQFGGTITK